MHFVCYACVFCFVFCIVLNKTLCIVELMGAYDPTHDFGYIE